MGKQGADQALPDRPWCHSEMTWDSELTFNVLLWNVKISQDTTRQGHSSDSDRARLKRPLSKIKK